MNCSSNPKSRTMPAPDKKRRELIGAQGNRPTTPKPRILLGQVMNPSCTDGFYENAMVRAAGHLEGSPLMTVRKIGVDDLKEFSGDMYGDINYKKALHKPEPTPRMSKVRKSKSEELVDAKEERNSCEAKALKPLPYYTDIDESQIRECIAPISLTPPPAQTDELSELIYEAPSHLTQPPSHLPQPPSHLTQPPSHHTQPPSHLSQPPSHHTQPPVSPVKRSASLNTDRRETNRNPLDTYYQVEDPYLEPKSKISYKSADHDYQIEDPYLEPKSKISYKSADHDYQIEDPYLEPKSKISYKSADQNYQIEDPYLEPKSKISYKSADQNYQIEDPYLEPKSKISLKPADPYFQFEDVYLQINQVSSKKKTPAKPKWRLLGGLGKKGQKMKGSSSEQNLSTQ